MEKILEKSGKFVSQKIWEHEIECQMCSGMLIFDNDLIVRYYCQI